MNELIHDENNMDILYEENNYSYKSKKDNITTTEDKTPPKNTTNTKNLNINLISDSIIYDNEKIPLVTEDTNIIYNSNDYNDLMAIDIYNYYIKGGYKSYTTDVITKTLKKIFILCFSTFILSFIDWNEIKNCKVDKCNILYSNIFQQNIFKNIFIIIYITIYSLDLLRFTLYNIFKHSRIVQIKDFFYKKLQISDMELQGMKWNKVLDKIVDLHNNNVDKIFTYNSDITNYTITHAICRFDNYMISLNNFDLLNIYIPFTRNKYITQDLEWFVKLFFMKWIFDRNRLIDREYIKNKSRIKNIIRLFGFAYMIFIPFKLTYYIFHFIFNHTEDLKSQRLDTDISKLGWTNIAKLKFREYNELKHFFDKRIQASYKYADMYHKQYYKPVTSISNIFIIFICKSFLSIIVLFALIDDEILLNLNILDKNLLWYIAFLTIIISSLKSGVSDPESLIFSPEKIMHNISIYTHYFPDSWKNNCHKICIRKEFNKLYISKFKMFLYDLLFIFLTPVIFIFQFTKLVDNIIPFIKNNSDSISGIGNICKYSHFQQNRQENIIGNKNNKIINSYRSYQENNHIVIKKDNTTNTNIKLEDFFLKPDNKL